MFRRFTEVVHVHVGGQVIRTTKEHPFYAYEKGWTAAQDLVHGDWILTAAGDWKQVEESFATGWLEVVYNLRVADYHTYFVGGEDWGWAAWVHNICEVVIRRDLNFGPTIVNNREVFGTAQDTNDGGAHAAHVNAIVQHLTAQAPVGTYFVLNRTWRTALGRMVVPTTVNDAAKKRPDILIVQPIDAARQKWKVHAVEVRSEDQTTPQMLARMEAAWHNKVEHHNGEVNHGTFEAVSITGFPTINW